MEKKTSWFVMYSGTHTGFDYKDQIIGITDTEDKAKLLLDEIIHEDVEIFEDFYKGKKVNLEYDRLFRVVSDAQAKYVTPSMPVANYRLSIEGHADQCMNYWIEEREYYTM